MKPYPIYYVGKIVSLHGYKGYLVLSEPIEQASLGEYLFVKIDEKGVPFFIEEIKGNSIVKLKFINDDVEAKTLVGLEYGFVFDQTDFVPTEYSEFELIDITTGNLLKIQEAQHYPQGLMWVCTYNKHEVLVPAVEDWIENVDWDAKKIHINLPEGLVEW